jgi:hypothetical protein
VPICGEEMLKRYMKELAKGPARKLMKRLEATGSDAGAAS